MNLESRNYPAFRVGMVKRALKNLRFVKDAYDNKEDIHIVTQVVTSLYGLVLLPYESSPTCYPKAAFGEELSMLYHNGWPQWSESLNKEEPAGKSETLGDLVRHIRNALAHGHIWFSSNSRDLKKVTIRMRHATLKNPKGYVWEAEIPGESLYRFCIKFANHVASPKKPSYLQSGESF